MDGEPKIPKVSHLTRQAEHEDDIAVGEEVLEMRAESDRSYQEDYLKLLADRRVLVAKIETARREEKTEHVKALSKMLAEMDEDLASYENGLVDASVEQEELEGRMRTDKDAFKKKLH